MGANIPDRSDKNVYILGAGFSKELGLPLQDDFLLVAKEVFFRDPKRYNYFENVFRYQDKLSKMRKFLNYPLLNLEQLFNLVEMDKFYSGDEESISKIKNDFVKLINDTLLELTPNPFLSEPNANLKIDTRYWHYQRFLKMFFKESPDFKFVINPFNDTIISLNYDLVVETLVCIYNWEKTNSLSPMDLSNKANYYIKLNSIFGKENIRVENIQQVFARKRNSAYFPDNDIYSESESSIKLIKLHGSINWVKVSDSETFIVPPTWNKTDSEIRRLWNIAYKELQEAKRIIIIGYSFPETDIYVKSLLTLALNENKILQNIYFINPDTSKVKEACLSLLDKHFEKHCEYKEWTFGQLMNHKNSFEFVTKNLNRPFP